MAFSNHYFQAVIFDMDGLLVDSEPLWTQAEQEVFATVGIPLSKEDCRQTVGIGLEEVVALRYAQHPWSGPTQEEIATKIHQRVVDLVTHSAQAMPGALQVVQMFRSFGIQIGLATSSDQVLIQAALGRLKLYDLFDHIQSASQLPHGKPHPQVYLTTADALNIPPMRCLAFEDSINGLIAAKAARMLAVAVPDKTQRRDKRFQLADLVLDSLEDFDQSKLGRLSQQATCLTNYSTNPNQ